ncbi:MAG: hypothetical protein CL947_02975 [Epsilonproteobacteria bacterium]|nr:hypothetical protein [Campylobacterota bacterium]
MKKRNIVFTVLLTVLPTVSWAELYLVDQIDCVVCGPERNTPIVDTDITIKRNLDGQKVPLQNQVQNDIISQQILADKIPIDPTAADKYIDSMKKQNNLTDSDLAELFEQVGRTFTEGLGLLSDQYYHEMFMHHKFKSQLVATDDDIKQYYEEHPEYSEGWCELQVAYVDYTDETKDTVKQNVEQIIQGKQVDGFTVDWSSPMKVKVNELVADKKFIFDLDISAIAMLQANNTFELYKLIDKKSATLIPLEDVRSSITDKLNRKKLESMLSNYNQEVRKFIDIIDLSDSFIMAGE